MAEQSIVRFWVVAALAWRLAVYWSLFIRDWPGWQRLKGWRAPKGRKRRPKLHQKAKRFEGLTRKPVCEQCAAAEAADEPGSAAQARARTRATARDRHEQTLLSV